MAELPQNSPARLILQVMPSTLSSSLKCSFLHQLDRLKLELSAELPSRSHEPRPISFHTQQGVFKICSSQRH